MRFIYFGIFWYERDRMANTQINLRIPDNLLDAASSYAENFGFRNVQDLAVEALREKIFEENRYDESFSDKEIDLIERLAELSIRKNRLHSEEEILKKLRA